MQHGPQTSRQTERQTNIQTDRYTLVMNLWDERALKESMAMAREGPSKIMMGVAVLLLYLNDLLQNSSVAWAEAAVVRRYIAKLLCGWSE